MDAMLEAETSEEVKSHTTSNPLSEYLGLGDELKQMVFVARNVMPRIHKKAVVFLLFSETPDWNYLIEILD